MDSENMVMPVAPSGGFGMGGDWAWIILLLVLFGGFGGGFGGDNLYPWINNAHKINDGFRDQMLNTTVSGISDRLISGFGDITTQLCNGFNSTQMALSNCCCENRAAIADLKYTLATEACASRATSTANTQRILDQMCADKLEEKNDEIAQLRSQIQALNLAASQTAQTAALVADNTAQTQYIVNRVAPYPIPAYVVANPVTPV